MKLIKYPLYILSISASSTMTAFAADNSDLEEYFNTNINNQIQLCGVCHVPNGLADVEGGDNFLLYSDQSRYESFYDAWVALGEGVTNSRLLTMNSDPALNHTGLQNWPTTSAIYEAVEILLTCWDQPALCQVNPSPDSADIGVSMTGNNGQNNNGIIRYSIILENAGPATANTLEIMHQLPPQVTLSEVNPSSIAYTLDDGGITLYLDSLATGSTQDINITVNTATTNNTMMTFSTSVSSITEDTNLANNSSLASFGGGVIASNADLSVSMKGNNGKNQNGVISYSITVDNAGPTTADSLEITHQLPAQVSLNTVTPNSIAYTSEGDVATFYLDTLETGISQSINITVSTDTDNKDKMDFTTSINAATEDPDLSNNLITVKFGGSIGWYIIAFSGLLFFARKFKRTLQ